MKLSTSQVQKQLLLPQMIRTMELLELGQLELKELIEEELVNNPVLEIKKNKVSDLRTKIKRDKSQNFDFNSFLDSLIYYDWNLKSHLLEQINFQSWSDKELKIAELIISSLSENGFLQKREDNKFVPVNPVELIADSDITLDEFERVREKIKHLDPLGVACYTFHEFLLLQVEKKYGNNSLEYKVLKDFSDLIEKRQYTKISQKLGITNEKLKKVIENIGKLNLTPVEKTETQTHYIVPDAFVKIKNNGLELKLAEANFPEIKLKEEYLDIYENMSDKKEKKFLREYIDKAKNLIENLNSRKEILYKVILKIVEKQKDFFLKGSMYLTPLKLKDIADELNIAESTVSRVIKGRYLQTNRGIFPLKYFLSGSSGGEDVAKNSVKEIIKNLIENEDKTVPFTDEMIVELLKKKGIKISRRTVAKYRGELNIPSAFMRKKTL
ncbi:MAG: RNA polymerase factor sigma-54 [Brevinematia bacterium]